MSYVLNNKSYDSIDVSSFEIGEDLYITLLNNSSIEFDVSNCKIESSVIPGRIFSVYKAVIDYGDGTKESYFSPIKKPTSTIGISSITKWNIFNHEFLFEKEYVYSEDVKTLNLPYISIKLYIVTGESKEIKIPYRVMYKSFYDIGSEFDINSANLTSENTVSYVLNKRDSLNLVLVNSKDWKKIYGTSDVELVKNPPTNVKTARLNYDYWDSSTWDWKTKPRIEWILEPTRNQQGEISFKWKQAGVVFDEFKVYYKKISDAEYQSVDLTGRNDYTITYCYLSDVLEMYFEAVGENGINIVTDKLYFRDEECNYGSAMIANILQSDVIIDEITSLGWNKTCVEFEFENVDYIDKSSLRLVFEDEAENSNNKTIINVDWNEIDVDESDEDESHKITLFSRDIITGIEPTVTVFYKLLGSDVEHSRSYEERFENRYLPNISLDSKEKNDINIIFNTKMVIDTTNINTEGADEMNITLEYTPRLETKSLKYISSDYNRLYYENSRFVKNEYNWIVDGTLIPDSTLSKISIDSIINTSSVPRNISSSFSFLNFHWSYPRFNADVEVYQTYQTLFIRNTGEYKFTPYTIFYIGSRDPHADIVKLSLTTSSGEVIEEDMSTTDQVILNRNDIISLDESVIDSRDTIFKRSNDYETRYITPLSDIEMMSDLITFVYDPLYSVNYSNNSEFVEILNNEELTKGDIRFYSSLKNKTFHKVIANLKCLLIEDGITHTYYKSLLENGNGIFFEKKLYLNEFYDKQFERYEIITSPNILNKISTLDYNYIEVYDLLKKFLNIDISYLTQSIPQEEEDKKINYQANATFSVNTNVAGTKPNERVLEIIDKYDNSKTVLDFEKSSSINVPFAMYIDHEYEFRLHVNDQEKYGDVTEIWKFTPTSTWSEETPEATFVDSLLNGERIGVPAPPPQPPLDGDDGAIPPPDLPPND